MPEGKDAADEPDQNQQAEIAANEIAEPDNDSRGQRQFDAEACEQRRENRNDLPKQQRDDAAGNAYRRRRDYTIADLTARCSLTFFSM